MQNIKDLFEVFPRPGRVEWIGIRPERRGPVSVVQSVEVSETDGLIGDHYSGLSGSRHVTLIQAEHLPVVAALTGLNPLDPALVRRNIVVSGLNLLALKDHQLQIVRSADAQSVDVDDAGRESVILQVTGQCHPCSKMEIALGPGGYNAMRGHGGLTARVIRGGTIGVGNTVEVLPAATVASTAPGRPESGLAG